MDPQRPEISITLPAAYSVDYTVEFSYDPPPREAQRVVAQETPDLNQQFEADNRISNEDGLVDTPISPEPTSPATGSGHQPRVTVVHALEANVADADDIHDRSADESEASGDVIAVARPMTVNQEELAGSTSPRRSEIVPPRRRNNRRKRTTFAESAYSPGREGRGRKPNNNVYDQTLGSDVELTSGDTRSPPAKKLRRRKGLQDFTREEDIKLGNAWCEGIPYKIIAKNILPGYSEKNCIARVDELRHQGVLYHIFDDEGGEGETRYILEENLQGDV